ncbi:MAG TPA: substrate-binding domain-containing protein [Pyrinomonadaceae bacterium]|jgi:ribose transport system substrate-binding protein|nr:substrate-binding domain-containing protein [Pyrinomonadaceae bacterium]
MKKTFVSLFVFALSLLSLSCVQPSPNSNAPASPTTPASPRQTSKKLTIAMIPKGTTHEFWRTVHAGAVKAARELSTPGNEIELIWKGPLKEDDREQQIQVVEGFTSQGVNGIVLAPLDNRALVRPVEEAKQAGIPTVIFDSGLESENIVSYVATDNRKGGTLAADRIGEVLGGKGKVLMLRYAEGSASTIEREAGFVEQLKAKHPGIELISSDQYAGPTRDTAKRASENLLNRYVNELQGIFTVNENSTAGMQLALQDIGKAGKIAFVGFDSSQPFIEGLRNGQLQGFVVQNPFNMGYLAIKTMVDHLQGRPVERHIDTGVSIITPENLDTPEVKERLNPPTEEYLK